MNQMQDEKKKEDLKAYRIVSQLTILQLMGLLAILGIVVTVICQ